MNIGSLDASFIPHFKGITQTQNNYSFKNNINCQDVFIKSADNISFKGTQEELPRYEEFREEITDYLLNEENATPDRIEEIVQKYSPTTTIGDLDKDSSDSVNKDTEAARTCKPVQLLQVGNELRLTALPKTILIRTDHLKSKDKNIRLKLLTDITHEMTHIMQSDSEDREQLTDIFNDYYRGKPASLRLINAAQYSPIGFQIIEGHMLSVIVPAFESINPYDLPTPIDIVGTEKSETDKIFKRETGQKTKGYAEKTIKETLTLLNSNGISIDIIPFLKVVSLEAQNEKEAYRNGSEAAEKVMGIESSTTDVKLVSAMYDEIDKAAQELLAKECRK